jgi:hypothetical protein
VLSWIENFILVQLLRRGEARARKVVMEQPRSWRTTVTGGLSLLVIGANVASHILAGTPVEWMVVVPVFLAGLQGLLARDQKAHEEGAAAK